MKEGAFYLSIPKPIFFDYLIIDDDGWKGIREDAPDEIKAAFYAWQQEQIKLEKQGIKN